MVETGPIFLAEHSPAFPFVGTIKDAKGQPIMIDQLWGINFGGGTTIDGNPNQLFLAGTQ